MTRRITEQPQPGVGNEDLNDVAALLSDVSAHPTLALYTRTARTLKAYGDVLSPVRIALLSSFTIDPLAPYLIVECAREGFAANVHVGHFHSVLQQLHDPNSTIARTEPDIVVIAQQLEDVSLALSHNFLGSNAVQRAESAQQLVQDLFDAMRTFRQRHRCAFVIHNFARTARPLLGVAEYMSDDSQSGAVRQINDALIAAARTMRDVFIMDFDFICSTVGFDRSRDERGWYLGRAPLSTALMPSLAREHARIVRALHGAVRKCLVVDLDNTLWGGFVGEDGFARIRIGNEYPGNAYLDFQRYLLRLHQRGVLLAINSANNSADVAEVFRRRSEMVLGLQHFAATRINWSGKPGNMRSIADELNIGTDALVFFDDSSIERARMRAVLPEVLTLEVPAEPAEYARVLEERRPFDKLAYTDEDRQRGAMHQRQGDQQRREPSAASHQAFLQSLGMRASVLHTIPEEVPRIIDLLRKTNQFNVTGRRYSATDVDAMLEERNTAVFSLRAADRFDDYGLVGAAIVHLNDGVGFIDCFVMSCRVIGRALEDALMARLGEWANAHGAFVLEGEFFATSRNAASADLFRSNGFTAGESSDAVSRWTLNLQHTMPLWPVHISSTIETTKEEQNTAPMHRRTGSQLR